MALPLQAIEKNNVVGENRSFELMSNVQEKAYNEYRKVIFQLDF
jgi:hypothetical protein